ncbi:MAG: prepilin peptidase [Anaerolineae bacterium]|nr:prepilin peptidase [Anaerolineae bacterium]
MIQIAILAGVALGCVLNWASDLLPRYAVEGVRMTPLRFECALARLPRWLLHLPDSNIPGQWYWLQVITETVCGVAVGLLYARYGISPIGVLLIVGFAYFWLVALIDLKYQLVLNVMTYPAILGTLAIHLFVFNSNFLQVALGGIMAYGIFALVSYLRPGELGGGDTKLAALIGLIFGFPQILIALLLGTGIGGVLTVLFFWRRAHVGKSKKGFFIPYAPFLCLGAMLIILYQPPIM